MYSVQFRPGQTPYCLKYPFGMEPAAITIELRGARGSGKTTAAAEIVIALVQSGMTVRYVGDSQRLCRTIADLVQDAIRADRPGFNTSALHQSQLYEVRDIHEDPAG